MNDNKDFSGYANSFQAVTVPGLERISALCSLLGDPQDRLKFIHVAGTNGKGSVCANLAAIAAEDGLRVGKYISPNLIKVNERISINGVDISDSDLNRILARLEPLCTKVEQTVGTAPTQFEIWTALAFVYFEEKKCDIVVLEVGLGGELDATNVIKRNEIAVITRLGLDHTQYLGNTLALVASAKCGIMKTDCSFAAVVTTEQDGEAMEVITRRAEELGHEVIIPKPTPDRRKGIFERFTLWGMSYDCGIAGYHQIENAALAIAAARRLGYSEGAIKRGVMLARNPARFELISKDPTVIYDGGHNENGIEALNASLKRYFDGEAKTVIFACMADKDIRRSLELLSAGETEFIFTTVKNNPRAMSAMGLKIRAEGYGFSGDAYEEIGEALTEARSRGRLTVICGSLYLYNDLYEYLNEQRR